MAANSFTLKSWSVTLTTGILALVATGKIQHNVAIVVLPLLLFWFLDSYYLMLERRFRALFDHVRISRAACDFDLSFDKIERQLSQQSNLHWWRCLFSPIEWLFYVSLGILAVIAGGLL